MSDLKRAKKPADRGILTDKLHPEGRPVTPVEALSEFFSSREFYDGGFRATFLHDAFKEVADLNDWYEKRCRWFEAQLAEAQKDTERLDWLSHHYTGATFGREFAQDWREAIDAAKAQK